MLRGAPRRVVAVTAAIVAVLVLTGCGDSSNAASDLGEVEETVVSRRVVIEVFGAEEVELEEVVEMRIVVREGRGESQPFAVAHAGFPELLPLDDGRLLNIEVGLVGLYQGGGSYELPAGIGQAPVSGPTVPSPPTGTESVSVVGVSVITLASATEEASEVRYGYLLQPCTVELAEGALEGDAICPALVAVDGSEVSFRMRWSAAR